MEAGLQEKMENFQKDVVKTGEDIVFRVFPTKILLSSLLRAHIPSLTRTRELNQLLQSMDEASSPFHTSHLANTTDPSVYPPPLDSSMDVTAAKKRKLEDGDGKHQALQPTDALNPRYPELVKGNQLVSQTFHKALKDECEVLAQLVDKVRLWVALTLPKIEDGDNFGVGVQEEVLGELHRAQEAAFNLRDIPRQSYLARAKICSKLIKYPNVEDYTTALKEHDQKQFFLGRQHLLDIRNVYATMTDMIHKNISKIRKPKGDNSINLY